MARQDVDIAIIGAGVVGLATALEIAPTGLRIAVFDAQKEPNEPSEERALNAWSRRVTALTPASIKFLESLEVWQSIHATQRVGAYTDMCVWDAEGTGCVQFTAEELRLRELGSIVESSVTVDALKRRAALVPNIQVFWDTRLDALSTHSEGAEMVTSSGDEVVASLTIGADGGRSKSRDFAAMRTRTWSYQQQAIVATVSVEPDHAATCWQAFLPSGPLALLPLADQNLCSIVWSLDETVSQKWIDADDEAFIQGLNAALSGRGPRVTAVSDRQAFPLVQCHAVNYFSHRFVLVGDAAHSIHPLAGQGINLGLSDARVLGGEICRAYERGADWGASQVLSRYERQRKGDNLSMMAAMQAFKWGFGSTDTAMTMLRNMGLNSVNALPRVKKWFIQQAVGG